jgi:hypothetical protein
VQGKISLDGTGININRHAKKSKHLNFSYHRVSPTTVDWFVADVRILVFRQSAGHSPPCPLFPAKQFPGCHLGNQSIGSPKKVRFQQRTHRYLSGSQEEPPRLRYCGVFFNVPCRLGAAEVRLADECLHAEVGHSAAAKEMARNPPD